jgi:hypothetical protein
VRDRTGERTTTPVEDALDECVDVDCGCFGHSDAD